MAKNAALKLSVNNGFMMKRWPEAAVWADLIANQLEVDDVQFSLDLVSLEGGAHALDRAAREVVSACSQSGVRVSSVFSGLGHYSQNLMAHPEKNRRLEAFEQYKRAIDFSAALGVDTFGGHMGAMSVRDFADASRRSELRRDLLDMVEQLAVYARAAGLSQLLWEPMPVAREWPSTVTECQELAGQFHQLDGVDLGYCLDVGHCCRHDLNSAEQDPYRWVRELAKFSPIIHIQQTDGLGDRHWPFTQAHNEGGIIHPKPLFEALKNADNSVVTHLTLEVFPAFEQADAQVLADMKASCAYWR